MTGRLFIHAANIHQGGGRSLLDALLEALKGEVYLTVDERMPLAMDMGDNVHIKRVKPSVVQRFIAEKWLVNAVVKEDVVLCFGNLPPLFKLRGHTMVFLQNRYLIENISLAGFSFKDRLRIKIERLWLSTKISNASEFIVQTPTMKSLLEIITRGRVPVQVLPFLANSNGFARSMPQTKVQTENNCDFVYVASGEAHKNHRQLIEAWCMLANEGLFPSLRLTLDRGHNAKLCSWIEQKVEQYRLNVENAGNLPHGQVIQLYGQAGALIYPSTFESFGLPLIEARQANLAIIASELDYVRDILDPEETFDPSSPRSIARAVKRFLGYKEKNLPLADPNSFLKFCMKK